MSSKTKPELSDVREPITRLVTYGNLQDVLKSQASPEFKAACIVMAIEAKGRLKI